MCTPLIHYTILNDPEVNDSVTFTMTSKLENAFSNFDASVALVFNKHIFIMEECTCRNSINKPDL